MGCHRPPGHHLAAWLKEVTGPLGAMSSKTPAHALSSPQWPLELSLPCRSLCLLPGPRTSYHQVVSIGSQWRKGTSQKPTHFALHGCLSLCTMSSVSPNQTVVLKVLRIAPRADLQTRRQDRGGTLSCLDTVALEELQFPAVSPTGGSCLL